MKRILALCVVASLAVPASAAAVTSAQKAALQAQVNAALPAAQAQVAQAAKAGTLPALVSRIAAMPHPANATTPSQYALILAMKPYSSGSVQPVSGKAPQLSASNAGSASYCYYVGSHVGGGDRYSFYEGGVRVAWIEKDHGYWCGNGYSITQNGLGFYHGSWGQTPWCYVITNDLHGWDGPNYSWAHGGIWASFGAYTPWITCATWNSGHAVVRIAGNGWYDYYDDYGF